MNYSEVKKESDQLASAFIELGLEAGERVALAGDNCLDWLLSELGALKAGLVVVRVPMTVEPEQLDLIVQHFQVRENGGAERRRDTEKREREWRERKEEERDR